MLVEAKAVDAAYRLRQNAVKDRMAAAVATHGIYGAAVKACSTARPPVAVVQMGDIQLRLNGIDKKGTRNDFYCRDGAPRPLAAVFAGALINYHYHMRLPDNADNGAVRRWSARQKRFPWRDGTATVAMPRPPCTRFMNASACFDSGRPHRLVVGGVGVGNAIHAYLKAARNHCRVKGWVHQAALFSTLCCANRVLSLVALVVGLALGGATPLIVKACSALLPVV